MLLASIKTVRKNPQPETRLITNVLSDMIQICVHVHIKLNCAYFKECNDIIFQRYEFKAIRIHNLKRFVYAGT